MLGYPCNTFVVPLVVISSSSQRHFYSYIPTGYVVILKSNKIAECILYDPRFFTYFFRYTSIIDLIFVNKTYCNLHKTVITHLTLLLVYCKISSWVWFISSRRPNAYNIVNTNLSQTSSITKNLLHIICTFSALSMIKFTKSV